jgi:hypothetical protein
VPVVCQVGDRARPYRRPVRDLLRGEEPLWGEMEFRPIALPRWKNSGKILELPEVGLPGVHTGTVNRVLGSIQGRKWP